MSNVWIGPIFAGLVGTTVLTVLVSLPRFFGMKSADMVNAIVGSIYGLPVPLSGS